MSIQTNIAFLNANDTKFQKALHGTSEERKAWEDEHGDLSDRPGALLEYDGVEDGVWETDDEYGGYVIELACIPEGATHIVVFRS